MSSSNKVEITINAPVSTVFNYTTDPVNTPRWILSVVLEERSDKDVQVGTQYRQLIREGSRVIPGSGYVVTAYEQNKVFELRAVGGEYKCRYEYADLSGGKTLLVYTESTGTDNSLESPLNLDDFSGLKQIIEAELQ